MRFCLLKSCLCVAACLSSKYQWVSYVHKLPLEFLSVCMKPLSHYRRTNKRLEAIGVNLLLICLAQWPLPPLSLHTSLPSSSAFLNICRFQLWLVFFFLSALHEGSQLLSVPCSGVRQFSSAHHLFSIPVSQQDDVSATTDMPARKH